MVAAGRTGPRRTVAWSTCVSESHGGARPLGGSSTEHGSPLPLPAPPGSRHGDPGPALQSPDRTGLCPVGEVLRPAPWTPPPLGAGCRPRERLPERPGGGGESRSLHPVPGPGRPPLSLPGGTADSPGGGRRHGGVIIRARQPRRLPAVLARDEVRTVLSHMVPPARTVALLLYGGGLRLHEALHLRVRDQDEARGQLTVRSGKGDHDRVALYPKAAREAVGEQLLRAKRLHARDLARGAGHTVLPSALPLCSGPSKTPSVPRACPTTPLATPSATPLPLTSWKMDTTSGSSRSSWATGASGPP
jgi:hypothetical protein